ncbi:DUF6544 family protein [Demequina mangrovi]|uniref:Uncharacterized protein n=1 Tax=Demequina mangrovi TaxID=1043493 RepID=A0A1H6TT87_9MICO|nr:DUF6544 family protein [Demequina mangrovi]SEI83278.1 hypothetical protein SAMN05421637_0133 [Demequina mangrovi]
MPQGTDAALDGRRGAEGARALAIGGALVAGAAAGWSWRARGPRSMRARFRRAYEAPFPPATRLATEEDIGGLPDAVARWLRHAGVVGKPVPNGMRARLSGRLRGAPDAPWMVVTGAQVNTFGADWTRWFHLDARLMGLPVEALHVMERGAATMRVDALSLVPVIREAGPEMNVAESVTLLNDACLMAPAVLLDAPIEWRDGHERGATAVWTADGVSVSAALEIDEEGRLVDFVSRDRYLRTGRHEVEQVPWATPVGTRRSADGVEVCGEGVARWGEGEDAWTYLEMRIDQVDYSAVPTVAGA